MNQTLTGGLLLARTGGQSYKNTSVGDVLVYTGTSGQNILMGPCNANGNSVVSLTSNNMLVDCDTTVSGVSSMTELHIGMGNPVGPDTMGNYVFSNAVTFAGATTFAGFNKFDGTCNVFSGPVVFTGSNAVTIGSNAPSIFPLAVQSVGSNNISIYAAGDVAVLSDRRHKTDLIPIPNALAKVNAIAGYTFSWIGRNTGRSAGVIAQEVQAVLPEVVASDENGTLCVSYGNLNSLLIQAIKELDSQMVILPVTTTTEDEEFEVELPSGKPWSAAFISGGPAQYSRTCASIAATADKVVGRAELPGSYQVIALHN